MTKTNMGEVNVFARNPLDTYAYSRKGNQITVVDRRNGEALLLNLTPAKAKQVLEMFKRTRPNRDIGKIEFGTKDGVRTVDELIKYGPDGTLKAKLGMI